MASYMCVAAASSNPPHFIHLCHRPPNGDVKTRLAIVGKGLTFDSGGYNIKTGSIELMQFDMGGSAAVFGAGKVIGQIKPSGVEVHCMIAACENMISGTGGRPGDIVTASNGKTIEANNTDAEGRLTLADALVYACKKSVHKDPLHQVMTEQGRLFQLQGSQVRNSGGCHWGKAIGSQMKSDVADMVNTGGHQGGAITAALFLKQIQPNISFFFHRKFLQLMWSICCCSVTRV